VAEPKRAEQGAPPEVVRLAHPTPEQLRRFLLGELSQGLRQAIVRHLLTHCPQCLQVTREMWRLGSDAAFDLNQLLERTPVPPPAPGPSSASRARSRRRRRRSGRSAIEKAFQELLIEMARELAAFHDRLQGALAALPNPKPADEPQAAVSREPEVQPSIEGERQALAQSLADVQALRARQAELKAQRQEVTQQLKAAAKKTKESAIQVRSIVRGKIGPRNERLSHFKVAVIREGRRKKAAEKKKPDGEKPGTDAGAAPTPPDKAVA
jgi:cell pole-organizing protein PopZ